jgi:hypothetical protein
MRHPVLFVILAIIGVGMISSLFNKEPTPEEQQKTAEYIQQQEKDRHDAKYAECKKKFPMVKLDAKDFERLADCMK